MRTTTVEHISKLQENPKNIRNICILAHVDHGKTTLADSLVASNGIISSRLAGKLRYMDSREDEQIRGITMKSSAVSLHYAKGEEEYLINLIDSPGHVDFSSEVSTAVRLCDGAIVVVDAVEGVSPQTQVVLRQAWLEDIRPCLVINKIDRLITELKYSPMEAYIHLQQILEQVNAITGKLFSSEVMEKSSNKVENTDNKNTNNLIHDDTAVSIDQWSSGLDEVDDSTLYFSPDLGNVVFASAIDGWGFSIHDFAGIYSKKLGLNCDILRKTLWGDYYLDTKSKRIFKKAQSKGKKPLFVQFILQNIWSIYDAVVERRDKIKMEQIVQSLNLKMSVRDSRSNDTRVQLQAILGKWLPLSNTVLNMVVTKLPSPLEMDEERVENLMCSGLRTYDSLPKETRDLKQSFLSCKSSDGSPVIVFVSKMFAVDDSTLPKHKKRPLTQEEIAERRQRARERHAEMQQTAQQRDTNDELSQQTTLLTDDSEQTELHLTEDKEQGPKTHFIAFARVYSGTIKKGQSLYVLGPRYDPSSVADRQKYAGDKDSTENSSFINTEGLPVAKSVDLGTNQNIASFTVDGLYLLMGRELESMDSVPAGNVLGIGGLHNHVLKSATVADTVMCPPFTALHIEARPIVRVAIEPVHYADLPALTRGIRLLNQADPCVETFMARTGEVVIVAAGEVHLQKCIDDLKEKFACVPFCVSSPIIPFRETIIPPPKIDMVNEAIAGDSVSNPVMSKSDSTTLTDQKDKGLVEITTANKTCMLKIRAVPLPEKITTLLNASTETIKLVVNGSSSDDVKGLYNKLKTLFSEEGGSMWKDAVDCIWAFGPDRTGPSILLNRVPSYNRPSIWNTTNRDNQTVESRYRNYDNSILSGFQLATLAGPLCEEPLMGVCFVIEDIITEQTSQTGSASITVDRVLGENGLESDNTLVKDSGNDEGDVSSSKERTREELEKNAKRSEGIDKEPATDTQTIEERFGMKNEGLNTLKENDEENMSKDDNSSKISNDSKTNTLTSDKKGENLNQFEMDEKSEHTATNVDESIDGKQTVNTNIPSLNQNNCNNLEGKTTKDLSFDRFGPFSGQLMSAVKEGCRRAFQLQPMRLMAAMYTCHVQATAEVLGRMYAVIGKREGRVLSENMIEGSDVFDVEAVLPVAESFGFSEEIRKRTSGLANPQLVFSHWEVVDIDPYWVPTTEEEYTHFGAKADSDNQARKYMNTVRKRKGLYVEEKTVEHAEKQRTLKK